MIPSQGNTILCTLWFQLEDMFQLIVMPQGIEKVTIQLIDTPTKVYAIGARLFLSKVPLEVVLRASSSRFAENLLCLSLPCQVQLANLQVEFV